MKRVTAFVILIATLVTSVFSLSGCNKNEENVLQMGEWLMLLTDSFGMVNYVNETPYFEKVNKDNEAFKAFQMAVEWGVLEVSDEISASTLLTWNDILITLVNAGEFVEKTASTDEKIEFAIKNFDSNIEKSQGEKYIKLSEAIPLLSIAQSMWANKEYTEKIESISFSGDVKNYLENTDIDYLLENNVITAPIEAFSDLKVGDIYVLPRNEMNLASINKVKDIQYLDEKVLIYNEADFEEVEDYIGEVLIKETAPLDFGNLVGIYDENGNPITYQISDDFILTETNKEQNALAVKNLTYLYSNNTKNIQTGIFDDAKASLKFKVKEFDVTLKVAGDDISVELSKEVDKISNRYREQKKKEYLKTSFEGVKLTTDIDYSWGVLHSAILKLDYKATVEGGIKTSRQTEIGNPIKGDGDTKKGLKATINQYKKALENFNKDMRNSKCNEDIYICKLKIANAGFASVDFIIKGKVSAEGELKVVVEVEGAQGIQYHEGKLRYINEKGIDIDFAADANLEITIGPGLRISILNKIVVAEFTVDAGVGASVEMIAHLFDVEGHELYSEAVKIAGKDADAIVSEELYTTAGDIKAFAEEMGVVWEEKNEGETVSLSKGLCLEWKLYPILKLELSNEGLVAKAMKNSLSKEILGKKDTVLKGHIDFPNNISSIIDSNSFGGDLVAFLGINAECTYDYTPWENISAEETEIPSEQQEILITDTIEISSMSVFLNEGQSKKIEITGLPSGYELKDIEAEVEDTTIASFDIQKGAVTGEKAGSTQLVIQTKDGKYKVYCAIIVNEIDKINFEEFSSGKIV